MPTLEIGTWARKTGRKWHIVESVIAGDATTYCGRRINEDQVSKVMPLTRMIGQPQLCKQCDRAPLPEDDGSTAPTDDTP